MKYENLRKKKRELNRIQYDTEYEISNIKLTLSQDSYPPRNYYTITYKTPQSFTNFFPKNNNKSLQLIYNIIQN